jgi:hypothetical protein
MYELEVCNVGPVDMTVQSAKFQFDGAVADLVSRLPKNPLVIGECVVMFPVRQIDACSNQDHFASFEVDASPPNGDSCLDINSFVFTTVALPPPPTAPPVSTPTIPPISEPVLPPVTALDCILPVDTNKYSVITIEDATIGAHNIYKGLAIGGILFDGTPSEDGTVDRFMSYVNVLDSNHKFNFNGGLRTGETVNPLMIEQFKYLAIAAQNSTIQGKKVVVVTRGGTYNTYDFNNGGQGEDDGNTVVVFNTDQDIYITKTSDGRQFGPSIIAPFAKVSVGGEAGFVNGFIMAKTFETTGNDQGALQLHGKAYNGQFICVQSSNPAEKPPIVYPVAPPFPNLPRMRSPVVGPIASTFLAQDLPPIIPVARPPPVLPLVTASAASPIVKPRSTTPVAPPIGVPLLPSVVPRSAAPISSIPQEVCDLDVTLQCTLKRNGMACNDVVPPPTRLCVEGTPISVLGFSYQNFDCNASGKCTNVFIVNATDLCWLQSE